MHVYVFYFQNIDIGGCELLIEKLAKELLKNYKVYICCQSISIEMRNRFDKSSIEIKLIKHWNCDNDYVDWALHLERNLYEITFLWDDFIFLYNKDLVKSKTIFYNVHYKTLSMGSEYNASILRNFTKKICFNLVRQYSIENRILATDEQTVDFSNNYYRDLLKNSSLNIPILRIPLDIVEIDGSLLRRRAEMKELNILTIARSDFPFKGYMFGLIDFINNMDKELIANLTIITYGKEAELIYKKVQELSSVKRNKIHIVGKTDYDELQKYMMDSNLYIGMGTTLLDASVRGIISIPVKSYTTELLSDHFFYEDIFQMTADHCNVNKINDLVLQVSKLSSAEYYNISIETIKRIKDIYGSEAIGSQLEDLFSKITYNNTPTFKSKFNNIIMNRLKICLKRKGILKALKRGE